MYPWIPLFIRTLGYLPDSSDVISEVPEYSEIQFWGGGSAMGHTEGAYIALPDLLASEEGTRCPLPNNPTPAVGPLGLA